METFLISSGVVALAEIGDKTQLLAFVLAARYRKPVPIILGILIATLANHGAAGALGAWVTSFLSPETLRWVLAVSFIAMAVWILVPDDYEETEARPLRFGVFITTLVIFFLVEIGDKTQIATIALAAQYQNLLLVVLGTTLGMMITNVPAVIFGERVAQKIPVRWMHAIAAVVFFVLGIVALLGGGSGFGL